MTKTAITGEEMAIDCVVLPDGDLVNEVRAHFATERGIHVWEEKRRSADRRTRPERRSGTTEPGDPGHERRRGLGDRRLCARRIATTPPKPPPALPPALASREVEISFCERPRVRLALACAYIWQPDRRDPDQLSAAELSAAEGRQRVIDAVAGERPVWVQLVLKLAESDEEAQKWYEGSLDVWQTIPDLTPAWGEWKWIADLIDLDQETVKDPEAENRLWATLPDLYGRGVFRSEKDVFSGKAPKGVQLFPAIGFSRALPLQSESDGGQATADEDQAPVFWALRTNVAVVGDTVVSVRLHDLLCVGRYAREDNPKEADYASHSAELRIPERYFPRGKDVTGAEIAEAIAHHQASTTRSAAETIRGYLQPIEEKMTLLAGDDDEKSAAERAEARREEERQAEIDRQLILDMSATVDQLERQVGRLLRRFGRYGDKADLIPEETKLRYGFAIDELRSLRSDCKRGMESISARLAAIAQADRNRFELAAALLASLILAPTLVAGFFGANVDFPGSGHPRGLTALFLATVAFVALGLLIMSAAWSRNWNKFSGVFSHRYLAPVAAITFLASLALAFFIAQGDLF
jgi:hypothetical protein